MIWTDKNADKNRIRAFIAYLSAFCFLGCANHCALECVAGVFKSPSNSESAGCCEESPTDSTSQDSHGHGKPHSMLTVLAGKVSVEAIKIVPAQFFIALIPSRLSFGIAHNDTSRSALHSATPPGEARAALHSLTLASQAPPR